MRFSSFPSSRLQDAGSRPQWSLFVLIPACWPTYPRPLSGGVRNVHYLSPPLSERQSASFRKALRCLSAAADSFEFVKLMFVGSR